MKGKERSRATARLSSMRLAMRLLAVLWFRPLYSHGLSSYNRGHRAAFRRKPQSSVSKLDDGFEFLYGLSPVYNALVMQRREAKTLFVQEAPSKAAKKENRRFSAILELAEARNLQIESVDKGELNNKCAGRPHQGVILLCSEMEPELVSEVPKTTGQGDVWLALDEVTDPQNLGAMLRSAYFLGARGVLVTRKNSARLSPVVSKASAGALEIMTVHAVGNMPVFLHNAAEKAWRVIAADVGETSVPFTSVEAGTAPTIIVLGSEGRGLRTLLKNAATQIVTIPHGNFGASGDVHVDEQQLVDSLNVSVSAGILLSHFLGVFNSKPT